MPSNFNLSFEEKLVAHFTPAEIIDFLGISMEDVIDRFQEEIELNYSELVDELG